MSGGRSASLPTSVEELRALVVELVEANAGLREVIAAKDDQIASAERRIAELEQRLGAVHNGPARASNRRSHPRTVETGRSINTAIPR